ncbi:MAG: hypothetical protein K8S56_06095, partial [Candidatus Cloacimonetes bacterium]|nr:hypothetical protein [Candidatus Cloacimonadota bacterium]
GFIKIAPSENKQAFHDRIAGTLVVSRNGDFVKIENTAFSVSEKLLIAFSILIIAFNIFFFSIFGFDSKLTPSAQEWKYRQIEEENPEENGFYYLIGFGVAEDENLFQKGFEWIQFENNKTDFKKNQININADFFDYKHAQEIGICPSDSLDTNSLLLKNEKEIRELYSSTRYLDERLTQILSKTKSVSTLAPCWTGGIPVYLSMVNFFRLEAAIIKLDYLKGDYTKSTDNCLRRMNQLKELSERSHLLMGKLIFVICDAILQNTISDLISYKQTEELTSMLSELRFYSKDEISFSKAFLHEANMYILKLMNYSDDTSFIERANLYLTAMLMKPNHTLNLRYNRFKTSAELSEMSFKDFATNYSNEIEAVEWSGFDAIRNPYGFVIDGTLGNEVFYIHLRYFVKAQVNSAMPILLKLKDNLLQKINSENMNDEEIQALLNSQPEELKNPFTGEPVSWNSELRRFEFDLPFVDDAQTANNWIEI